MKNFEIKMYTLLALMIAGVLLSLLSKNSFVSGVSILLSVGLGLIVFNKATLLKSK
jgi:VIT1/CCC1 family predicted Fe2+/Mn2+ transporter